MEGKVAGGEVRRLHVIYFLSHMGRVDHPHLIRVQHLTRNGVYLRDVKRWLADLRGKEIVEAYSWSYKRRYKAGYVWQDLLDDDLITPISDNEYVLKGSEIISSTFDPPPKIQYVVENKAAAASVEQQNQHQPTTTTELIEDCKIDHQPNSDLKQDFRTHPDSKIEVPTKIAPSGIHQESPCFGSERSSVTDVEIESDESMKNMEDHCSSSLSSNPEVNKMKKNMEDRDEMQETPTSSHSTSSSSSSSSTKSASMNKSKSYSSGASNVLRNLMGCGAVDTNDAVLVMSNRRGLKTTSPKNSILRGDKLGGSARDFGTRWNPPQHHHHQQQQKYFAFSSSRKRCDGEENKSKKQQQSQGQSQSQSQSKKDFNNQKAVSAAYRPVREPNCSQCGKPFKPEKMHSHMKSCRGIKALAKAAPTSLKKTAPHTNYNDSASSYLLTN